MKMKSELPYEATVQNKKGSQLQLLDLPMDILLNIISRLSISYAIRTSILSSQLKYVWRDHCNLIFNCYTLMKDCENTAYGCRIGEQEFIARVNAILQQHSGTGVDLMKVVRGLHNKHADHLDRWVKFAILSKTKKLILDLWIFLSRAKPYNFPCHLFDAINGSYMQCLQLTYVSLNLPPDFGGFLNLKKLTMQHVNITEEHVEYLLSKCNLLEFFGIAYCRLLKTIRAIRPLSQLKHLQVNNCIFLEQIEMNCALKTLEYIGPNVSLEFATTSKLRNVRIRLLTSHAALDYITTGFPSTLPHLETLNLHCTEHERAVLPMRYLKYINLRYLRLELIISGHNKERNTDVLDYAYLLDAAPSMEEMELHMLMDCHHQPYRSEHGELRSLPSQSHQHTHLRSVYITGFFGHKDQVELALHILRRSAVLEVMEIDPRVKLMPGGPGSEPSRHKWGNYIDGRKVATEFVRGADHKNVVEVAGASPRTALDQVTQTATRDSTCEPVTRRSSST